MELAKREFPPQELRQKLFRRFAEMQTGLSNKRKRKEGKGNNNMGRTEGVMGEGEEV